MEINLSETELRFLAEKFLQPEISFEITGPEKFTVIHPKAEVPCEILGFTTRSIQIGYDLVFFKNLLVKWFVNIEKDGIYWDKKKKQVNVDPFYFLPEKLKKASEDFSIQEISLKPGLLLIRLEISPETTI